MAERKAVFFDIDGTLWDFENRIPESAVAAIRALQKNGHLALLCSGRTRAFIREPRLLDIGFDGIVSGCGTMIEYEGRVIFRRSLEQELLEHTVHTVRRYGFRPILEGPEYLYMDKEEFAQDPYGKKLISEMGDCLLGISEHWGEWEVSKLACATDGADREACYEQLARDYDYIIHNEAVTEMIPKGFGKDTGIRRVCGLLGMPLEDTFAFGDGMNDIGMFEVAGTGIAMGNGSPAAKEAADYVTDPLHEDGIWNACARFGLI